LLPRSGVLVISSHLHLPAKRRGYGGIVALYWKEPAGRWAYTAKGRDVCDNIALPS